MCTMVCISVVGVLFVQTVMAGQGLDSSANTESLQCEDCVDVLSKKAKCGDPVAQYQFSKKLANGEGVGEDKKLSFEYALMAAKQGYGKAYSSVAKSYWFGNGISKNIKESKKWYAKFIEWIRQQDGNVDADTLCDLGFCYSLGIGVEKNDQRAISLYRKAAERGCAAAQWNLCCRYMNGSGVQKDEKIALRFCKLAAEKAYPRALNGLGRFYYDGVVVEKDLAKAVQYYELAAAKNFAFAQYNLGLCYFNGEGVKKDWHRAKQLFEKASANGYKDAEEALRALQEAILLDEEAKTLRNAIALWKSIPKKTK